VPICSFDAKTGILCSKCEGRLRSGHLTKTDVDISMRLSRLAGKIPELNRSSLLHALEVKGEVVLVMGVGDHTLLRRNPAVFRRIEKELGVKVWIIEGEASDRKILEDLLFPIKILTVNVVWLPDGSKLTKVIIPGRRTERFPIDLEQVKSIVKAVRGMDLLVEFEKQ